jgi:hypothetical protein
MQGGVTRSNEKCHPYHHHALGANGLIKAIGVLIGDFWGNILGIFSKKSSQKF